MHTTLEFQNRTDTAASPRERNRLRIVDALRSHGSASRSELARTTGLSRTTVASLVADLQARGLVADGASQRRRARSGRGRPPALLRLHPAAGAALGLRIGDGSLDLAVADLSSTVLAERRVALEPELDIAAATEAVADGVGEVLAQAGVDRGKVRGAVLSVPSTFDPGGWAGNAGAALSGRLGIPVQVEDEANLGALGELAFGAARGLTDVVYVSLSSRIGAGLVLGGRLHRGATGVAGELGHLEVRSDGPLCRCGNRGCLETVASIDAVLDVLRPVHGPGLGLPGALRLLARGDSGVRRVLADAGRATGRVLAGVCTCLNPQSIVVGGELSAAGEPLLDGLREALDRYAPPEIARLVTVEAGTLGRRAALLGALTAVIGEPAPPRLEATG